MNTDNLKANDTPKIFHIRVHPWLKTFKDENHPRRQ
jgi:hypothetical protein